MKQGRSRTMSICLSDIPKERILKHTNGKLYLPVSTFDYDEEDQYGNDFSVSIQMTKEEIEAKKSGIPVQRIFIGNGKIWEPQGMQQATADDVDDLPF